MGTCSSSGGNNIDDTRKVKEVSPQNTNIDLNDNLEKEASKESLVLKLLDGHYNFIHGPDPNSIMLKVEGDKVWIIDDEPDRALTILEYGKVEYYDI